MAESIQKKTHGDCELQVRKKVGKIAGSEYMSCHHSLGATGATLNTQNASS